MIDILGRAVLVSTVAALFVEALLRVWRVERGAARLELRAASLAAGAALPLLFEAFAPFRLHDWFLARFALFVGGRWDLVDVGGFGLARLATFVMACAGLAFFLLDLVPSLLDATVRRRARRRVCLEPREIRLEVTALAAAAGQTAPPVSVLDASSPAVLCGGALRPQVLVSTGALAMLDAAERRAALAHEFVHARHRDPLTGWVLMAVRALCWFSPAIQIQARALVGDLERRADDESAMITGDPLALASTILRLHRGAGLSDGTGPALRSPRLAELLRRARVEELARRCRRLLDPGILEPAPPERGHLIGAVGALLLLAFLVV